MNVYHYIPHLNPHFYIKAIRVIIHFKVRFTRSRPWNVLSIDYSQPRFNVHDITLPRKKKRLQTLIQQFLTNARYWYRATRQICFIRDWIHSFYFKQHRIIIIISQTQRDVQSNRRKSAIHLLCCGQREHIIVMSLTSNEAHVRGTHAQNIPIKSWLLFPLHTCNAFIRLMGGFLKIIIIFLS